MAMEILKNNAEGIAKAARLLEAGALVAVPTETVYGLAADAKNPEAVLQIYRAKGRPSFNPLIAHVCSIAMAEEYCVVGALARSLMEHFWPGPLTLVLPLKEGAPISSYATAGLKTLAVRQPIGTFSTIIAQLGRPVVAPSANASGKLSPTTVPAVLESLGDHIAYIVAGGACSIGVESTIIKPTAEGVMLLRPGGLPREVLEEKIGAPLLQKDYAGAIEAPGMLRSHYAPRARLRLNAKEVTSDEGLLCFGAQETKGMKGAKKLLNLSAEGNLLEAAQNLFAYLKAFDDMQISSVAVQPIPREGLGEAINDRLSRASVREE